MWFLWGRMQINIPGKEPRGFLTFFYFLFFVGIIVLGWIFVVGGMSLTRFLYCCGVPYGYLCWCNVVFRFSVALKVPMTLSYFES